MTDALKPLHKGEVEYGDPEELNKRARRMIEEKRKREGKEGNSDLETSQGGNSGTQTSIVTLEDCIELQNIQCVDASGTVFEKHNKIYVMKDVVREQDGTHKTFTPYQAIAHMEQQGMVLPSMALSCNILAALYNGRKDPKIEKVLQQYKNHGSGFGWHAQNTIVDWKNKQVIHNPNNNDFPNNGGNDNINTGRKKCTYDFNPEKFGNILVEDALKIKECATYLKNLTGLVNPEILEEIGKYFKKPTKIWVPNNPAQADYTSAVWLGCYNTNFSVIAYNNLYYDNAARGVSLQRPQGAR